MLGSTVRWSTAGSEIFFHLCVVIVQEYFALNTEAGSLMVVLSLSKSFLPVMEYLLVTVISERLKTDQHTSYPCSFKDCAERELVAVICPYCEKNFCLRHRHQSDHECEKLEIPKPRMAATQKLVKDIIDSKTGETANKRRKGAKSSETAAKVALMKLKMHADGDKSLPQISNLKLSIFESANLTERIYFQVFLPKGSKEKSKPMFFCHRWSIGKAIDFAASLASLKNDNNKLTAKKLRLCHITSGEALPLDHALETWIAKEDCPLYNGGNIILEYLNDEEQFCKNVESYLE
ncbi:AN1-type zinc finger protein 1 isoform X3 [Cebus imitator]|uniref:AN1-type zinc finger protein 1 isoform X3 n=1 Tax=Cebus imitator TaxID=2715852 RepID=UPI001899808C|nr:AN1-type zinc finger protein 1 isoform X3 [Cebus imitator]